MSKNDGEVKCRKPHICEYCRGRIEAGELAKYFEQRVPTYDDKLENQIGIQYIRGWVHYSISTCHKIMYKGESPIMEYLDNKGGLE